MEIGPYKIDFISLQQKLVIELDHCSLEIHREFDWQRVRQLRSFGFRVIRFWKQDVVNLTEQVLMQVRGQVQVR